MSPFGPDSGAIRARLDAWTAARYAARLWDKDHTLWSPEPVPELTDRLGWLTLPDDVRPLLDELAGFAADVRHDAFRHVVLCGMGGSSLAPEVYQRTFGNAPDHPELIVIDSTHPGAVRDVRRRVDPARTLFLVSSKSGTTLETMSFFRYFWAEAVAAVDDPGSRFVAITDPGTPLERLAEERSFRRVFPAPPDVGGRYSAFTTFGLVPAALIGVDLGRLLDAAAGIAAATRDTTEAGANEALHLGAALGELARAGRDKATFVTSDSLAAFPAWIEQLIAESTGKDGAGIVPVAGEPLGPPTVYGNDRVFIYLGVDGDDRDADLAALAGLEAAGHPVLRYSLDDRYDLGREIFRLETATAAAGSVLGIHPFNQPDVQIAKELAKKAMAGEEAAGEIREYAIADEYPLATAISTWLGSITTGDYVGIQAYLAPTEAAHDAIERIRVSLRDRFRVATTTGWGPRFLHSTGQLHKGGPGSGIFLQLVDSAAPDLPVPETDYSFGRLIAAQAAGDYGALRSRNRRVLRIDIGDDPDAGLGTVAAALGV